MPIKWPIDPDLTLPAGVLLTRLGEVIPLQRQTRILVFGSAALQITVAPAVLSADADVAPDLDPFEPSREFPNPLNRSELAALAVAHKMAKGQGGLYLHICSMEAFDPGTLYPSRALKKQVGNCQLVIPHPIDILVAKLHRYDAKDREDFREVFRQTGFPTFDDLLTALRQAHRVFNKTAPSHGDMPSQHDPSKISENTPQVFLDLYGREISVQRDIIAPVKRAIEESYSHPVSSTQISALAAQPLSSENLAALKGGGENRAKLSRLEEELPVSHMAEVKANDPSQSLPPDRIARNDDRERK